MVTVKVCVGSSCHMKGSYQVIKTFTELAKSNDLDGYITLKASFCLGCCLNGIATMVDDKIVENVGFSNAEKIFYDEIYPVANAQKCGAENEQKDRENEGDN